MSDNNVRDIDVYINEGINANTDENEYVKSVNGMTGVVEITKQTLSIENVDNTSDLNKPVSNATQSALNTKANASDLSTTNGNVTTLQGNLAELEGDFTDYQGEMTTALAGKLGVSENAVSATKLNTARNINGVAFDGTQNITITANPNAHNHIVEMDAESQVPVADRTYDKRYYNITDRTNITNGTASVSNMYLV